MIRAALFASALLVAAPTHADTPQTGDVVPDLTAFTDPALMAFEYFGEGRPNLRITIAPTEDFALGVTVEETGFLDDSVAGIRDAYVVQYTADGWEVLSTERLYSCYRTPTQDWQAALCP